MTLEEPMEGFPAPLDTDPGTDSADSAVDSPDRPMLDAVKEDDPVSAIAIRREILPETRQSRTHKFMIGGHEGYLTIGLFEDGRPGEVFIKMSKEGSTLSGLIQGFCRAFSLAIQHGLSIQEAVARFRGMRFEPMGATSNPEIPEASSILDYVARYLEVEFLKKRDGRA